MDNFEPIISNLTPLQKAQLRVELLIYFTETHQLDQSVAESFIDAGLHAATLAEERKLHPPQINSQTFRKSHSR